jgi:Zn-finger nucleic acid-binding protein
LRQAARDETISDEVATTMSMSCPRCNAPLARLKAGAFEVSACWKCAGLFAPNDASKHVADKLDLDMLAAISRTDAGASDLSAMPDGTPAIACPMCGGTMDRANVSGTTLDFCKAHGTWFDAHELERVMRAREGERQNPAQTSTDDSASESRRARAALYTSSAASTAANVTETTAMMATEVIADVAVDAVASGAAELAVEGVFAIIGAIFD